MGATLWSTDLPGRPTRGRDIQCPRNAACSPSPLNIARSRALAHSPSGRPSKEVPALSKPIVQQLFKDGVATGSPAPPQIARTASVPQRSAPKSAQGATPTQTPDAQRRSTTASPSPKKTRSQLSPTNPKHDMTLDGPTIADLTAMVQQLRLENRRLESQLAERKIEVEELQDDLCLMRRRLSAKMRRLFEVTGHKDLY